jgi:general secretion pathway protein H
MASEYAILNNQLLGFAIKDNGYEFLAFNGKSWQVISEPPLEPRQLPDAVSMELSLDGLPWSENNLVNSVSWQAEEEDGFSLETDEKEQEPKFPQVFLLPSGELSAFEIVLDSGDFEVANHKMLVRGVFTTPVRVGREEELQDDLY